MVRGKHMVFTLGRSGSNTLVDLLNQNPAILNVGEVLGEWMTLRRLQQKYGPCRNDDTAWLDAVLGNRWLLRGLNGYRNLTRYRAGTPHEAKALRRIRSVGFKEFSLNFDRLGIGDYPERRPEVLVIGLTRRNVIDRMISTLALEQTGVVQAHAGAGRPAAPKLRLDPGEALRRLDAVAEENERLEERLNRIDPARLFRIDYGDFTAGNEALIARVRKVYAFLGVPDHQPRIRTAKIIRSDPLNRLEHGAVLRDFIARTRHARWLAG